MADNDWAKRGEQLAMEDWRMINPDAPIEEFYKLFNAGNKAAAPVAAVPSPWSQESIFNGKGSMFVQPTPPVSTYANVNKVAPKVETIADKVDPTKTSFNSILGNNPFFSIDGATGSTVDGMTSSGWLSPAYKGAQSAWNAYQSYNAAKETKKQNKANLSKANEAMYRQGVDQRNKIAGSRRRQGMGLGNANNTGAMAGLVAANPYSEYRNYNIPY